MRALLLWLGLAGCAAVPAPGDVPLRTQSEDLSAPEKAVEDDHQWISVGFSILNRSNDSTSDVSDGVGFTVDGGYFLADGVLRPSIEVGGGFSEHDVQSENDDIYLWRVSIGGRLTWTPGTGRAQPYVRAGAFYRWNSDSDFDTEPLDQDGTGWYGGLGIDLRMSGGWRLGPFVQYYRGTDEDDLEETLVGVAATFEY